MPANRIPKTAYRGQGWSYLHDAALAALVEKPRHGYLLAHEINRRLGPSRHVEPRHIYTVLKRLEKEGLVRTEERPYGGRMRHVLQATDKARDAHRQWLVARPARTVVETDLRVRLAFLREDDVSDVLRGLGERRIDILEEIEENAADEPLRVSCAGVGMALARSAVDKALKAELEWIEEAVRELQALKIRSRR
jgi:DNA-binding PadR family transcriptional regulator